MSYLDIILYVFLAIVIIANLIGFCVAYKITENVTQSVTWCFKFSADSLFMLSSLCFFNFFCALLTNKEWNIRYKWMRYLWQTQDAYMNGMGFGGHGEGGDRGFYEEWNTWYEENPSYIRRVYVAWRWVQRNCSNGFSSNIVGLDRNKIIVDTVYSLDNGRRTKLLAYWKNEDGSRGSLAGWETRDHSFFFGRGKMRMGYKLDQGEKYYPAMIVSRYLPWKDPND